MSNGARLMAGQRIDPARAQKLVDIGRKEATAATRKVTASKLGGGRSASAGTFAAEKPDTSFRDAILAYNKGQRSSSD
jgi:hypothetical protein